MWLRHGIRPARNSPERIAPAEVVFLTGGNDRRFPPATERRMAMLTDEMMSSDSNAPEDGDEAIVLLADEVTTCAQTCLACADACLSEEDVSELAQCIRLSTDCADVCEALGRLLPRLIEPNKDVIRGMIELCAMACDRCAEECERHAERHMHCSLCAEACRRCAEQCRSARQSFI